MADNVSMTYNDDITAKIFNEWIPNTLSVPLVRHVNLEYFIDLRGKSIVDFGCGTGEFLRICMEKGAKACLGLDINEAMIKADGNRVSERTDQIGNGLHFLVQDCFKSPLEINCQFDFVVSHFVLHECKNEEILQNLLKNKYTILKPSGKLFIGVCPYVANSLKDQNTIADLCGYLQPLRSQTGGQDPYYSEYAGFTPCSSSDQTEGRFTRNELFRFTDYFWSKEKVMENVEKAGFRDVELLPPSFPDGVKDDERRKMEELEEPFICIGARKT